MGTRPLGFYAHTPRTPVLVRFVDIAIDGSTESVMVEGGDWNESGRDRERDVIIKL